MFNNFDSGIKMHTSLKKTKNEFVLKGLLRNISHGLSLVLAQVFKL